MKHMWLRTTVRVGGNNLLNGKNFSVKGTKLIFVTSKLLIKMKSTSEDVFSKSLSLLKSTQISTHSFLCSSRSALSWFYSVRPVKFEICKNDTLCEKKTIRQKTLQAYVYPLSLTCKHFSLTLDNRKFRPAMQCKVCLNNQSYSKDPKSASGLSCKAFYPMTAFRTVRVLR